MVRTWNGGVLLLGYHEARQRPILPCPEAVLTALQRAERPVTATECLRLTERPRWPLNTAYRCLRRLVAQGRVCESGESPPRYFLAAPRPTLRGGGEPIVE